ncbi:MAG: hypothetical protein GXP32_05215 [Kiritimatiellaeota bacterium]|nr:hypothetical protein [Kiritimatiellota bacterium]
MWRSEIGLRKLWGRSLWRPIYSTRSSTRKTTYAKAAEECRKRSAITYLPNAKDVSVDITTGIHDGHIRSVSVSHTIEGFNAVADQENRLTNDEIEFFVVNEAVPEHLIDPELSDSLYGENTPLFRRISGNARLTIFEGGHDFLPE